MTFPSSEHPLYVPQSLINEVENSDDFRSQVEWAKRAIEERAILPFAVFSADPLAWPNFNEHACPYGGIK